MYYDPGVNLGTGKQGPVDLIIVKEIDDSPRNTARGIGNGSDMDSSFED